MSFIKNLQIKKIHLFKKQIIIICFCLVLFFTLVANIANYQKIEFWQETSQSLIVGRMFQVQHGLDINPSGFLMEFMDGEVRDNNYEIFLTDRDISQNGVRIYNQQSGLQGTMAAIINQVLVILNVEPSSRLYILYFITAAMFVAISIAICLWLAKECDVYIGITAAFCLLFSSWMMKSAWNLYWVTWTMIFPLAVCAWLCVLIKKGKIKNIWLYFGVFISVLIKCLCGYEFITTVMLACEIPLVYYFFKSEKGEKSLWFKRAFFVGIAALLAFVCSLIIWYIQNGIYLGNWQEALNNILTVSYRRTGIGIAPEGSLIDEDYNSLAVPRFEVFSIYFNKSTIFGGVSSANLVFIQLILFAFIAIISKFKNTKEILVKHFNFLMLTLISFLASFSWIVLASGHSILHEHIDYIILFFLFIPVTLGHIFSMVKYLVDNFIKKEK